MKFISVVLLGFFTFFISCRELPEQINSPFQGNWSGDYQGAENGTLTFNPNSAIEKKEYFSILISNCVAVEKNKR